MSIAGRQTMVQAEWKDRITFQERVAMEWRERIAGDPKVLMGKPVIKGTRISVELIIDLIANGWSHEEILRNYPHVSAEDIAACLHYAQDVVKDIKEYPVNI